MKKILVVDDSEFMRRKMIELVEGLGHEIVGEAGDGFKAVELFKKLKPDLITLDITMPNMCGKEALMEIMGIDECASIIMCSTLGSEAAIAECIEEGAKAYIIKPFIESEAQDVIKQVLKSV